MTFVDTNIWYESAVESEPRHVAVCDTFHRYSDNECSFTDCASKVPTERLGVTMKLS